MKLFFKILCVSLFFTACKNNNDSTESTSKTEAPPVNTEQNIIPSHLLEKSQIAIEKISKVQFEKSLDPEARFQKVRTLCEKSKGYSLDIWEGVNECSWAVEQERINLQDKYVSRKDNQLILKMEQLDLNLEHNPDAPAGSTFYQFKTYIPKSKYFLIEEMISGKCIRSKLINATNSNQFNIKGSMIPSTDGHHFIAYFPKIGPSPICIPKLELYVLTPTGLEKNWHLPLNNKSIAELKYTDNGKLLFSILPKNKEEALEYFQLTWH